MKFSLIIMFLSFISLIFIRKHILLVLISIEFIVLMLLLMIVIFCLSSMIFYLYVLFMTLFVCEGVLGLSLLVNMIRCHGNDYLNSMFLW
uniref:NADH dehydrogenase subunit 4L n=1 Tax=Cunedda sp. 1 SJ-2023a TaxID=3040701 RepID=UPI002551CE63|nr:NADH dehydrogenase subunit 4L [Cunedda sp. 1 SJ-2023a]WGC89452.1 NADH dehydrogenase subunit 4L [Cunedda sp. 1 SJ-2023a]